MILWWYARSIVFEVTRWVTILFFGLLAPLVWPLPYKVRFELLHPWGLVNVWLAKVICGIKYQVHGFENLDLSKPSLILAHHESAWETMALGKIIPVRQSFVMKKELLQIPFIGWALARVKPIAIDRKAGTKALKQILEQSEVRIKQDGDWVTMFPEGTRVPTGTVGKINRGGAMLAKHLGDAPVYLITHNAGKFWGRNSLLRKPGVIDVYISEPLQVAEMSVEEINQKVKDWFANPVVAQDSNL